MNKGFLEPTLPSDPPGDPVPFGDEKHLNDILLAIFAILIMILTIILIIYG